MATNLTDEELIAVVKVAESDRKQARMHALTYGEGILWGRCIDLANRLEASIATNRAATNILSNAEVRAEA